MEPKKAWQAYDARLREIALGTEISTQEFRAVVEGICKLGRLVVAFAVVREELLDAAKGSRKNKYY